MSDNCSGLTVNDVLIEKVTSDEVDSAPGSSDGNTTKDIVIASGCRSVQLRAERDSNLNGRVYTITLRLRDDTGNTSRATMKVPVPLNQSGRPPIDSGVAYVVSSSCP